MYISPVKLQKYCFLFILGMWCPGLISLISDEKQDRAELSIKIV